jgi:Zn-dependent protease
MNFALGRFGGTEVRVHWTWVPILAFIAVVLGLDVTTSVSGWPALVAWSAACVTAALVLLSSVAHELAHVVVARRDGTVVPTVVVQLMGGSFVMSVTPRRPGEELRLAIAGPLVSLAIVAVCVVAGIAVTAIWPTDTDAPLAAQGVLFLAVWVGFYNGFLGFTSLIPGLPFDGGRIVHSLAWRHTGSDERATIITGRFCRFAGLFLLGAGMAILLIGYFMLGLMLIIVGGQLMGSAGFVERRGALQGLIAPIKVGEAAETDQARVPAQLTLDVFADAYVGERAGTVALVERGEAVVGLIGAAQIRRVPQRQWKTTRTEQAMVPIDGVPTVTADASLWNAMEILDRTGLDAILIALADGARGVVTRRSAALLVRARAQQEGRMDIFEGRKRRGGLRGR